jgi:hypothetical protein
LLLLLVTLFVAATLWRLGRGWRSADVRLNWPILLIVTLCLVTANLMQAMAWVSLLNRMAQRFIPAAPILSGFMAGQLARYIPSGKVALLVVRTAAVAKLGLPTQLVASSIGIEVLSWLTVGMLFAAALLSGMGGPAQGLGSMISAWSLPLAIATVLGIVVLLTVDRRKFPRFALHAVRAQGSGPLLSLQVLLWQAGSWLGPVIQGILLPVAVGGTFAQAWPNVGLFLLAPIAGFLALVAPGGLGVREAILSYALAAEIGPSRALAVALLARGTYIVSEVLAWLATRWLDRPARSAV